MKTVKIKVKLTAEQQILLNDLLKESEWVWNKTLSNQLHNHCITWYNWAAKLQNNLDKLNNDFNKLKPEKQQLVKSYYLLNNTNKPRLLVSFEGLKQGD